MSLRMDLGSSCAEVSFQGNPSPPYIPLCYHGMHRTQAVPVNREKSLGSKESTSL
jgi:hypothetical protein